jgi:hypothetical protein
MFKTLYRCARTALIDRRQRSFSNHEASSFLGGYLQTYSKE